LTFPIPQSFIDKCDRIFLLAKQDPVLQGALKKLEQKCEELNLTMYEMIYTLAYKDVLDGIARSWLDSRRTNATNIK